MSSIFDLFQTLASSAGELMLGSSDSRETFLKRQMIKGRTYQAVLNFWQDLDGLIKTYDNQDPQAGPDPELERILDSFRKETNEIFDEFEVGERYDEEGMWEGAGTSLGMQLHRMIWSRDPVYRDLEFEIEKFWKRFIALRKKEPTVKERIIEESLAGQITEQTANFMRTMLESTLVQMEDREHEAAVKRGVVNAPSELYLKFRSKLSQNLERELTGELKSDIAKNIAFALSQEVCNEMGERLSETLKEGQLIDISPGFSSVIITLMIEGFTKARRARIALYRILRLVRMFPPNTKDETIRKAILTDKPAMIDRIVRTFRLLLGMGKQSAFVVRALTGFPEWIESDDDIDSAARKFYYSLVSAVQMELLLLETLNAESESLLYETAGHLSEIAAFLIAANMEEPMRAIVYDRVYNQLAVANVFTLDRVKENVGDFIVEEIKDLMDGSFNLFIDRRGLLILQTFSKQLRTLGFEGIHWTFASIDDDLDIEWPRIRSSIRRYAQKDFFEASDLSEILEKLERKWLVTLQMEQKHTELLLQKIEEDKDELSDSDEGTVEGGGDSLEILAEMIAKETGQTALLEQETGGAVFSHVGGEKLILKLVRENVNASLNYRLAEEVADAWVVLSDDLVEKLKFRDNPTQQEKRNAVRMLIKMVAEDIEKVVNTGKGNVNEELLKVRILEMTQEGRQEFDVAKYRDYARLQVAAVSLRAFYIRQTGRRSDKSREVAALTAEQIRPLLNRRLEVHTINELRKYYPEYGGRKDFDDEIDYGMDTLEGVLGYLFREVRTIVARKRSAYYS